MESRLRVLLLSVVALALGGCSLWPFHKKPRAAARPPEASVSDDAATPAVVEPQVVRRKVKTPKIRNSNFEFGPYVGTYSAEDFGVNPVMGVRATYHITEDFFADTLIGQTKTSRTSYERLSGGAQLLTDSQRKLTYYSIDFGYNLFPGEVFARRGRAFNSALYVIGGVGATRFAGDRHFTVTIGTGYRLLLNDFLAAHIDVRDHLFDTSLLGTNKTSHNLEMTLGTTVYFGR